MRRAAVPLSLLKQPGEVLINSLRPLIPTITTAARNDRLRLNLASEQVSALMDSQADALGVRGFPPTVSTACAVSAELEQYKQQTAAQQRTSSAIARHSLAHRQATERQAARQHALTSPARSCATSQVSAQWDGEDVVAKWLTRCL